MDVGLVEIWVAFALVFGFGAQDVLSGAYDRGLEDLGLRFVYGLLFHELGLAVFSASRALLVF